MRLAENDAEGFAAFQKLGEMSILPFLIFDLDGTISDPRVGIARSMNTALASFGYAPVNEADVCEHIGPPLDEVFRKLAPDAGGDRILAMVAKYGERYRDVGYSENVVYEGIPDALEHLASKGIPMGVCTLKNVGVAEQILDLFGFRGCFTFVSGGEIGVSKRDQLRTLLEREIVADPSTMIGDRAADVRAARANGLRSVGVLWGHGSRQELIGAAPDRLLELPADLKELITTA